ncbi:MAG: sulfatase-like hydrolase/transferase, partial [Candidatus Aminicenantes bacterium]|nr:sulfatase-like hydrolase/transferase [Candidatus Aminicenantes bacterium]
MSERPNILLIIADDHRFNAVRAFGDPIVRTPVLDRLAGDGAAFRKAHMMGGTLAAVCVPSRACLLTGANVFRASCSREVNDDENVRILDPDLALLPEVFRQAGYRTFATGKWHNDKQSFARVFCSGGPIFFGGMSDHLKVPVHDFDPEGIYPDEGIYTGEKFSTELFTDAAVGFVEEYNEHEPFFHYLAFTSPHEPRMAPDEYADMYD